MILLIKHTVGWELIRQKKKDQISKDDICKNSKRVEYNYKIRDKGMLTNNSSLKYETPYNEQFYITKCWTNSMVTLHFGVIKIRYNTRFIKPYTSDTKFEDIIR